MSPIAERRGVAKHYKICGSPPMRYCNVTRAGLDTARMPVTTRLGWISGLDRIAIGLSGLCLVHCFATAVLVALAASAGGLLVSPIIHEIGLAIAIPLGTIALGRGIWTHGYMMPSAIGALGLGMMAGALTLEHSEMEVLYTLVGVAILSLGHELNRRATY